MHKIIITILLLVLVVATVLFYIIKIGEVSSGVARDVVVYKPSMIIGSLYENNPSFDEIDRTRPEGVLFCKTRAENTDQVAQLYTASSNEDKYMMEVIRNRGVSTEFKEEISQKMLLFSFYYYGVYGPPHWFCVFEGSGGALRTVFFLEKENGVWRQGTDVAKYPVRIAFFDLAKKHKIFDAKQVLGRDDIDGFINDCQNIDNIVATRMSEDSEHYGSVQILK